MANKEKVTAKDVMKEKNQTIRDEKYNQYVKDITPTNNMFTNIWRAYLVGGLICALGQGFINFYKYLGADEENAILYEILSLVLISVILTGFNLYQKLAKFAGAGSVVPITGFANGVASSAIEFQKEGQVFGIGCKIFTIAGPVILYGVFFSWVLGLIYWILKLMKIV